MPAAPSPLPVDEKIAALLDSALKLRDFFPEFTAEHAQKLFPRSGFFAYPQYSTLLSQGEPGTDLFVLYSGRLGVHQVRDTGIVPLATLEPGAMIGEIALLKQVPRTATVTALVDSSAFKLVQADLQYILTNNAELAAHLKALVSKRLGL